jgi:nucleoid-associated protein YgaU
VEVSVVTSGRVRHGIILALAGLLGGLGLVTIFFRGGDLIPRGEPGAEARLPAAALPESGPGQAASPGTKTTPDIKGTPDSANGRAASEAKPSPQPGDQAALVPPPATTAPVKPAEPPEAPRFDIVRVEPNGDAVIAGRGKPNTVVEMLVDGKPVAKALADPNGQFALVPPPLPKGSSEIVLRSRTADGQESRSAQSVAVSVSPKGDTQPLVALTTPDAPTVVLSQPGVPEAPPGGARPGETAAAGTGRGTPKAAEAIAGGDRAARIVSVDSEPGGKLFVTGSGAPGSQVRLYLNDTLIAPATVGPDGRVTFTIGRGVAGGQYQVRLDQVDPKTGAVLHRAEVPFAMPQAFAQAADPRAAGRAGAGTAAGDTPHQGAGPAGAPGAAGSGSDRAAAARDGAGSREDAARRPADAAGRATTSPAGDTPRTNDALAALAPADKPESRTGTVFVAEISTARIVRGDSLWQISRRTYGRGDRYTVIYDANQTQIRNPDLIYPGQIFVLPNERRG